MKKIMFLVVIIACLSAIYYLVVFLPKQTEHRLVLECRSLGEKIQKETVPKHGSALDPEFYYNPKLKKCFYCGGYIADDMIARFIVDAYTNKEIIGSIQYLRKIDDPTTAQEVGEDVRKFNEKKRELFNE
jgi:hypothetical protein